MENRGAMGKGARGRKKDTLRRKGQKKEGGRSEHLPKDQEETDRH